MDTEPYPLFCWLKDTKEEKWDMDKSISGPIFTQKISKFLYEQDVIILQDEIKQLWWVVIIMELKVFSNMIWLHATKSESREMENNVSGKYPPRENPKVFMWIGH